jgi:hypothetical protein
MPVMLPHKQLLIRCLVTSPVNAVTIRCYGTRKSYKCVSTLTLVSYKEGWINPITIQK